MGILVSARPGSLLFLHLSQQYDLIPDKSKNENRTDRSLKAITRLIISCIALKFFINMGFYFNLINGCIKGCLAVVCEKNNQTIGGYNATQYIQDAKRHMASMAIDLGADTFVYYYYALFALHPLKLGEKLTHLQQFVYQVYPLEVGEESTSVMDASDQFDPNRLTRQDR